MTERSGTEPDGSDPAAAAPAAAPADPDGYCTPAQEPALRLAAPGEPVAPCVLCQEPTEYAADVVGAPHCARCAWQQAQRGACSG